MKRLTYIASSIILLVLTAQAAGYFIALKSEAYQTASRFVQEDEALRREIGQVIDVSLSPLDSEFAFTANTGRAKFVINARTSKGRFKMLTEVEKKAAAWVVVRSSVVEEVVDGAR